MPYTIDDALNDPDITVISRDDHFGDYEIQIGSIPVNVKIQLRRALEGDETSYKRSHAIHTPTQAGPYHQGRPYWDYPGYALFQAISSLTDYYREAVKAGYSPKSSWLV